jgi:hypothetical protein
MNDLSGMFQADPDQQSLDHATPPDAPMAMPTQVLEQPPRRMIAALLSVLRPARHASRGV